MDTKTVIKYAAMAFAAYILWDKVVKPMLIEQGVMDGSPEPQTDTDKDDGTGTGTNASQARPDIGTPPTPPANIAPPTVIVQQRGSDLESRLQAKAGVGIRLNVDGWNYYMRELNPNAVVSDLFEVGVSKEQQMTPAQYLNFRSQAGLDPIAAAGRGSDTGTRASGGGGRGASGYFIQ